MRLSNLTISVNAENINKMCDELQWIMYHEAERFIKECLRCQETCNPTIVTRFLLGKYKFTIELLKMLKSNRQEMPDPIDLINHSKLLRLIDECLEKITSKESRNGC